MSDEISVLLDRLAISNKDEGSRSRESRWIRRKLRSLGHWGGLRGSR
jgi:hypothetical protein